MRTILLVAAAVATLTGTAAIAATPFVATAIEGDLAEMKMGALAEKKGTTPAVRAYGKLLSTDHGAHRIKAVALAKSMGVKPPESPSLEQKADYTMLSMKSGTDFDAAFKEHMIKDHQKDIAEYEGAAEGSAPGGDTKTASFARETLPTLKKHLAVAEKL